MDTVAGTVTAAGDAKTANDRAFALIGALAALGPGPQRLNDVAARAGLRPSTAHRILQAGIRTGAVHRSGRGRYALTASGQDSPARNASPHPYPLPPVSVRTRSLLAELQERTDQTVMLHVPVLVDVPVRYCLAYFAAELDEFMGTAERLLVADSVFCSPLAADPQGQAMLAHLLPPAVTQAGARAVIDTGYTLGPSPVAGWDALTAPLRRNGSLAGAVCLVAPKTWLRRHRARLVTEVLDTVTALGGRPAKFERTP